MPARPPPKSVLNVPWKFWLMATNASRNRAFDVSSYPEDSLVMVRVRDGRMSVTTPTDTRELESGGTLAVARGGAIRDASTKALNESLGWTDGRFVVGSRPLRQVLPQLKRWYALDLKVRDPVILDRAVTMDAQLGAPRNAIAALENGSGNAIKFGWVNDTMYLSDATKAAATTKKKAGKR